MVLKLYHNPSDQKCLAALHYIQKKGIDVQIIQYLKSPFTETELSAVILKLDVEIEDIIRKDESIYIQKFSGKTFTEKEWIKILLKHPTLIQRPIVVSKYKAVIADVPEKINELL